MSLLQHQTQHWPLALIIAHGEPSLAQHLDSLALWDTWFARAQPFHVIRIFLDAASLDAAKGAPQATQRWMSEGAAAQIREWVQSMSIVVPADQYDRMQKMSVRKAFGIPGGLFRSLDEAFAWLEKPPEVVAGTPVDRASLIAVRKTLEAIARQGEIPTSLVASTSFK